MARAVEALKIADDDLHVLVDGCNRPPELIADGEKWTRMSSKDIEAVKNQRKLSQFFGSRKSTESDPLDRSDRPCRRCRPKKVEAVIEGDGCVPSISAASIIAKVHRDRLMERIDKDYPLYGFNKHKGYGTEAHLDAIRQHGVCGEHRKSFAPIKQILAKPQPDISKALGAKGTAGSKAATGSKENRKGTRKAMLKAK